MDYVTIFDRRGHSYHRAMQHDPGVRRFEFRQAINRAPLRDGQTLVDVPAGGSYLRPYLPPCCHYLGHEPSQGFQEPDASEGAGQDLLPLPWANERADGAFSIAGVHHLLDKRPLFRELARVVAHSGFFILSDVEEGSAVARFLDEFVGAHNSTGHQGYFLGPTTADDLKQSGWTIHTDEQVSFHWVFPNLPSMCRFCRELFELRIDDSTLQTTLSHRLGVDESVDGDAIGLRWQLRTLVAFRDTAIAQNTIPTTMESSPNHTRKTSR